MLNQFEQMKRILRQFTEMEAGASDNTLPFRSEEAIAPGILARWGY